MHAEQVAWSQSYAARKAIRRTDVAVHRSHESTQLYNELVFVLHFFMLNSVPVGFILNVRSIIRSTTQNIRQFNSHTEKLFGNAGPPPQKKKSKNEREKKKEEHQTRVSFSDRSQESFVASLPRYPHINVLRTLTFVCLVALLLLLAVQLVLQPQALIVAPQRRLK